MNKEELIVELEYNDVQVNIDGVRITYCNSLDKELVKAIYNLQQENKKLNMQLDQALKDYDEEMQKNMKAIEYCNSYRCWTGEDGDMYETDFCIDELLEKLKGDSND